MAIDYTSLLGGLASSAVGAIGTNYAANQAANAATQSANQAAQMAQFRPVGVTTRFGKSGFNYDPSGRLVGAGYQVAPDVAAARECWTSFVSFRVNCCLNSIKLSIDFSTFY